MTDYSPKLVKEMDIRNAFTPPLTYENISKAEVLLKIEMTEEYIKSVYFDGSMPSKSEARIPALLLVMSKIIKKPSLLKKYGEVEKMKLGDLSFTLNTDESGIYSASSTWEDMAHQMLKREGEAIWNVKVVND